MFDYTMVLIARKEHEELTRKSSLTFYDARPSEIGPVRRALGGLGGVLVCVGRRLQGLRETEMGAGQVATEQP